MKLELSTSVKAVECANCILGLAIKELEKSPELMVAMQLSKTDITNASKFRKSMLKAFLKPDKNQSK